MENNKVRVRFAPSPTGYLHVGGARTVLFNYLYAKHTGGEFILRVEDTDQERSTPEAEKMQIEDIKWLGFLYDEGPDVGGPHKPYRQSERQGIFKEYAQKLMKEDKAYYCFCSDEVLDQKREAAMKLGRIPQYDGTCLKLSKADAEKRLAQGEKGLVRFKAPVRTYKLQDAVRGEVVFPENMVGDFVILRSGGMPVYNFCCVIDDHLMNMTHIIRAEEHLSNTVRQLMLYEAFGWRPPVFAHCSLILGADRQKLSKRHGATSVHQYAEEGYLKEALINFLTLLGWSHPESQEIMPLQETINKFSLERLNKAPSVFDPQKLKWMNGQYIRSLPLDDVFQRSYPFMEKSELPLKGRDKEWLKKCFELIRGSMETLQDVRPHMDIFFDELFAEEAEAGAVKADPNYPKIVEILKTELLKQKEKSGDVLSPEDFLRIQDVVKNTLSVKGKGLFMPVRVALTGKVHGPELKTVASLLGTESSLKRIQK